MRRTADTHIGSQADVAANPTPAADCTAHGGAKSYQRFNGRSNCCPHGGASSYGSPHGHAFNTVADPAAADADARSGDTAPRGNSHCAPSAVSQREHCLSQE